MWGTEISNRNKAIETLNENNPVKGNKSHVGGEQTKNRQKMR